MHTFELLIVKGDTLRLLIVKPRKICILQLIIVKSTINNYLKIKRDLPVR